MTRVKICGLTRPKDVECAIECGASAIGFVFEPSSPRCILNFDTAEDAFAVATGYSTRVAVFGHYPLSDSSGVDMDRFVSLLGKCDAVQALNEPPLFHGKKFLVIRLPADEPINIDSVDAVVLDAFDPVMLGGTGKTLDWGIAAEYRQAIAKPIVLAGGLTPENVFEAVQVVRPYAVDVSSGVEEAPGKKDHGRIRAFFDAVRDADRSLRGRLE